MPRVLVTDGIQQVGLDVLAKRQDVVVDRFTLALLRLWRGKESQAPYRVSLLSC
jgi:hypothetical protein